MSLPRQAVHPRALEKAYRRELDNLVATGAVRRLWAKDPSLWPADEDQKEFLHANLSWLDLPERIGPYMAKVADFANQLEGEGYEDAVFVGLNDSSLAAETVTELSLPRRWKHLFVLDTIDPATVRDLERRLNLERTIFIFASKSGKRIEGHALLLYFLEQFRLKAIQNPGRHFVAVTEESTYLAELATQYKFRGVFFDPPGIRGRYSALIHFGLLLSGLCRFAPASLLFSAASISEVCRHGELKDANPALSLAAFLAAGAKAGHDRVLLFGTTSLSALTQCVAQLIGVSTGKEGKGLVPLSIADPSTAKEYQRNCVAVVFSMRGDEDSAAKPATQELANSELPHVSIELDSAEELGAELFKWEIATALVCALLNVNPFIEPDLREAAGVGAKILDALARTGSLPGPTVRVREAGIELYAEGETRQQISTLSLSEALRTFFEMKNPEGYIAILAFLGCSSNLGALRRIGEQLAANLKIPSSLSFGPRYLHQLAQVFHGGPPKGLFFMLTAEPGGDIAIPGAGYSFGQLQVALAMGNFDALAQHHKPIVRLHLTQGAERGLAELERILQHSLKGIRSAAR